MSKAIRVPTGVHDKTKVEPIFEGSHEKVLDHFGRWKHGHNDTPLGNAKGIVVQDGQGRITHAASRNPPDNPSAQNTQASQPVDVD